MEREKTIVETKEMHELFEEKLDIVAKDEEIKPLKYTYEQILEQLHDLRYYTDNQIKYIYYSVNEIHEEANS
jgi:hypothetical protein